MQNRVFHENSFFVIQVETGEVLGCPGGRTEHTQLVSRTLAGFGLTWHRKVIFSTFSGKLTFQCTRNGAQNLPYCPGSLQDTFIFLRYTTNIFPEIFCTKNKEPGLESPVYGLLWGAPAPPRPPHIFCRPLPRPPRKSKIHGVGNPWGGKSLENPWTNPGFWETQISVKKSRFENELVIFFAFF